jgi:PAS domain S-box-containing protein
MDAPVMADATKNQFMSQPQGLNGRGRQKCQAQVDRRRERNRILARRTRLRKKFFFESLQKDVMEMQRENAALKEIVSTKLDPETSKKLLAECDAMEKLPSSVLEACGENTDMDGQDYSLVQSIQGSQQCFVITDPSLSDNPIVYASDGFLQITGYAREDVLGRNCRFLQGTETSADKVEQVRKAVSNGEDVSVTMINYTADGTAFWNKLFIAALRDAQNHVVNFIGVTVKVAAPEPGDSEAGKLLPGQLEGEFDSVNADVTVKALEGAVTKAVENSLPVPFFS